MQRFLESARALPQPYFRPPNPAQPLPRFPEPSLRAVPNHFGPMLTGGRVGVVARHGKLEAFPSRTFRRSVRLQRPDPDMKRVEDGGRFSGNWATLKRARCCKLAAAQVRKGVPP